MAPDLLFCARQGPLNHEKALKLLNSALVREARGHPPSHKKHTREISKQSSDQAAGKQQEEQAQTHT